MVSTDSGVAYEPSAVYVPSAYVLLLDASSEADAAGVGVVLDSGVAVAVASVVGSVVGVGCRASGEREGAGDADCGDADADGTGYGGGADHGVLLLRCLGDSTLTARSGRFDRIGYEAPMNARECILSSPGRPDEGIG